MASGVNQLRPAWHSCRGCFVAQFAPNPVIASTNARRIFMFVFLPNAPCHAGRNQSGGGEDPSGPKMMVFSSLCSHPKMTPASTNSFRNARYAPTEAAST